MVKNNLVRSERQNASLNGEKRILRDGKGRFIRGNCANPEGRGVGVRDKANQIKLAFFDVFDKTGRMRGLKKWVEKDRRNRREFYKMILSILPKDLEHSGISNSEPRLIIVRGPNKTNS